MHEGLTYFVISQTFLTLLLLACCGLIGGCLWRLWHIYTQWKRDCWRVSRRGRWM